MERHEIDAELNTPGAQELLAATSAVHLAYVGSDATPACYPVGFWWTGEEFVISTATTSPKVVALSVRPDVALAIDAGDSPDGARALSVRGRCAGRAVDGVVEEYLMAARKERGRRGRGGIRRELPENVHANGADRDHAILGALLRLRGRPDAAGPKEGLADEAQSRAT